MATKDWKKGQNELGVWYDKEKTRLKIFKGADGYTVRVRKLVRNFKTKANALKFARSYMRKN